MTARTLPPAARRARSVAGVALLGAALVVGGAGPAAAQCAQPYRPVHEVSHRSGQPPVESPLDLVRPLHVPPPVLDTDGDGVVDGIEVAEGVVRITRGSGVLELVGGPGPLLAPRSLGDLDGDGRTEVVVAVDGVSVIVPGSTPDGGHDLLDVGIRIASDPQPGPWVGDQDGDGIGDIATVDPSGPVRVRTVVSGADLVRPGPGGTIDEAPDPILTLGADIHGIVDLGQPAPTLLTYRWVDEGGVAVGEVTVELPEPIRLRTGDVPPPSPDVFSLAGDRDGMVTAWTTPSGQRAVVLDRSERGGGSTHVWNLDDPCAGAPASPAQPAVDGAERPPARTLPETGSNRSMVLATAGLALVAAGAVTLRSAGKGSRSRTGRNPSP